LHHCGSERPRAVAEASVPEVFECTTVCRDREGLARVFEREAPLHGVIHFAAHKSVGVSVRQPREYYDNNVGSLLALLWELERAPVRALAFSSSCTVYGQPEQLPVTEQSPIRPAASPYGRTKQVCEDLLQDVVASGGPLRAVSLRYFNPIGAHPSGKIGELPLGKPETLAPFGPRRPGDAAEVYACVDKARGELGWQARLGVREALRDAWNWQQNLVNLPRSR
jgi:UDP-glucose 4-epimerase